MENEDLSQLKEMIKSFSKTLPPESARKFIKECPEIVAKCLEFRDIIEIFNSQSGADDENDEKGVVSQ